VIHVQCVDTDLSYSLVGIDVLHKHAALTALHNSKARSLLPKCYPGTCVDVINTIMDWISNVDSPAQDGSILWLHGPLGSGKSTILQTVAERCTKKKRKLAGSFFFSSATSDRNTDDCLVATIAHQLASISGVRAALGHVVQENPSIFESSLEDQIESLIVMPLMQAVQGLEPYTWPYLVIIDGVDECTGQATQCDIIRSIGTAIREHELPLRFIITSRPEQHLTDIFDSREIKSISKQISLQDHTKDIEYYLRSELARIWEKRLPNSQQPTERDIRALLDNSRGQFLYPSMVIEFIGNPKRKPDEQLKIMLDIPILYENPTSPFAEFECIYDICGASHVNDVLTSETLSRPYRVCVYHNLLLDSREGLFRYLHTLSTGKIRALLQDVHAVWNVHIHRT
jgi:energy-coupling factor transporter ATP-binding protein EcfA2